jgi:hypothetical protein
MVEDTEKEKASAQKIGHNTINSTAISSDKKDVPITTVDSHAWYSKDATVTTANFKVMDAKVATIATAGSKVKDVMDSYEWGKMANS